MESMKVKDKIVILGSRYNPQLGTYLTGPYFGTIKRVNEKTGSISVKYENEADASYLPTLFNAWTGRAKKQKECLYGSIVYSIFDHNEAVDKICNDIVSNVDKPLKHASLLKMKEKVDSFFFG